MAIYQLSIIDYQLSIKKNMLENSDILEKTTIFPPGRIMSKNKKLLQANFLQKSYFIPDPWFKKLYYKINELVKEGKSKEEILKMKI